MYTINKLIKASFMRLFVLGALLSLSGLIGCTSYQYDVRVTSGISIDDKSEAEDLYKQVATPAVLVQAEGGLGSAVIFGDGSLALTAAHVVSHQDVRHDQDGLPMRDSNGQLIYDLVIEQAAVVKNLTPVPFLTSVTVLKIDAELDLAVLKLAQVYPYGKAKFASVEPYLYQKCWISGHPHGVTDTTITEGRVQALWDNGFIRYSAPSTFGNSGGPVWLKDGDKYLVFSICQRVHVEGSSATTHLGLGVLPAKMLDFVREYNW